VRARTARTVVVRDYAIVSVEAIVTPEVPSLGAADTTRWLGSEAVDEDDLVQA
jgi:hypothetical protein